VPLGSVICTIASYLNRKELNSKVWSS